ncbi:septal ring lytic transglycosylase RlpA family protein [Ramlibacter terrae]|uniref:Endolytic peptidoglycan transglycosylase RlpA n=1 Tax=Ramlibacter terrae TaxID=2732511 RepID=A0ABX6P756_9BURK|nr:septal ring lytic transglycosylase RlpA family protein [Ramlibacter terrae]
MPAPARRRRARDPLLHDEPVRTRSRDLPETRLAGLSGAWRLLVLPLAFAALQWAPVTVASELTEPLAQAVAGAIAEPAVEAEESVHGEASWYGPRFHGRPTASGERFDREALTAAHRSLPFGTVVRVENLRTGDSVDVRINDRGPHGKRSRIIDLSEAAGRVLGIGRRSGVAPVRLTIVKSERR